MSLVGMVTVAAAIVALAVIIWTLYVLFDVGFDGQGVGPWQRPQPRQAHSRLPADFIGLWSLFGSKSIDVLAGSREAAVRRLARLEANLQGQPFDAEQPVPSAGAGARPDSFDEGWLERRLDQLEALAGLTRPTTGSDPSQPSSQATSPPFPTPPSPAPGRS